MRPFAQLQIQVPKPSIPITLNSKTQNTHLLGVLLLLWLLFGLLLAAGLDEAIEAKADNPGNCRDELLP